MITFIIELYSYIFKSIYNECLVVNKDVEEHNNLELGISVISSLSLMLIVIVTTPIWMPVYMVGKAARYLSRRLE